MASSPFLNTLVTRIKKLEDEVDRMNRVIDSQQAHIKTLATLVNTMASMIPSAPPIPFNHYPVYPIIPQPAEVMQPLIPSNSSHGSTQVINPTMRSEVASNVAPVSVQNLTPAPTPAPVNATPVSNQFKKQSGNEKRSVIAYKRARAVARTKVFVKSLPEFGTKSIAVPELQRPNHDTTNHRANQNLSPATASAKKSNTIGLDVSQASTDEMHIKLEHVNGTADRVRFLEGPPTKRSKHFESFNFRLCDQAENSDQRMSYCRDLLTYSHMFGKGPLVDFLQAAENIEMFVKWIRDELDDVLNGKSDSSSLLLNVIQILESATWTEEIVANLRYDKLLRRIYKKCIDHHAFKNQPIIDVLRKVWPVYRQMYISRSGANGNADDEED